MDQTQKHNYSSQNKGKAEVASGASKFCNFCGYAWPHYFFLGGGGKQNALYIKKNVETVGVKTNMRDAANVQLQRDQKIV